MSTIRALEPLAEEIANFKQMEDGELLNVANQMSASGTTSNTSNSSNGIIPVLNNNTTSGTAGTTGNSALNGSGAFSPKFSFQLEKRYLSTIHLNAIARLYGDHGEEILELLRKNPVGTVPVILKRLKQKDLEWRHARNELNKQVGGWVCLFVVLVVMFFLLVGV